MSNSTPTLTTFSRRLVTRHWQEWRDRLPSLAVQTLDRRCWPYGSSADPRRLLDQIHSGQISMVQGSGPHGLILCKRFTSELVVFGGAVGISRDQSCTAVIPLGDIDLRLPQTFLERQWSYRRRILSIEWQQAITEAHPSTRRAQILLERLEELFPMALLDPVPSEVLANLVGMHPARLAEARYSHVRS